MPSGRPHRLVNYSSTSSNRIRCAAPSRSLYWPSFSDQKRGKARHAGLRRCRARRRSHPATHARAASLRQALADRFTVNEVQNVRAEKIKASCLRQLSAGAAYSPIPSRHDFRLACPGPYFVGITVQNWMIVLAALAFLLFSLAYLADRRH